MTDRELLEKAANAAGYEIDNRASFMTWCDSGRIALLNPRGGHWLWNPLNDDGDAFRLMVTLRLELYFAAFDVDVRGFIQVFAEKFGDDPAAATRRSIVRAAALMANEI